MTNSKQKTELPIKKQENIKSHGSNPEQPNVLVHVFLASQFKLMSVMFNKSMIKAK